MKVDRNLFRNNYANAINFGGNGRYFYRIDPTAGASTVDVVDSTLCTLANYISAGSWTVNPIIATITLTAGKTYAAMAYDPNLEEIACFSTDGTRVGIIDAKPSSGTFNTLLTTITTSFGATTQGAIYHPTKQYYFVAGGVNLYCWNRSTNTVLLNHPVINNQQMWLWMSPHTLDMCSSNTNQYYSVFRDVGAVGVPILKAIGGGPNNNFNPLFSIDEPKIMFASPRGTAGNISAMVYPDILNKTVTDFAELSTLVVSANRPMAGNRLSSKQKKLFYSTTGLVTGFVNVANPRLIASITTHTRTAVSSETSAARLCLNGDEDVLAIEPTGGTPQHMHIYNAVGNSYVGYVSFGKTGINANTYTSPLICNRWLN